MGPFQDRGYHHLSPSWDKLASLSGSSVISKKKHQPGWTERPLEEPGQVSGPAGTKKNPTTHDQSAMKSSSQDVPDALTHVLMSSPCPHVPDMFWQGNRELFKPHLLPEKRHLPPPPSLLMFLFLPSQRHRGPGANRDCCGGKG